MSDPKVFLNGKPVEHPHEDHHHVSPVWEFTAVFIALLFLTILTYVVSFAGLGPASLPVAMVIAATKGALVAGYFMHLKYEDRFYSFVFLVSLLFVAIFFTFTLFDMKTSGGLNMESDIEFKRNVEDHAEAAENAAAMRAAQQH
ncbi:cytochrome C oxidase subunit IV family protein [Pseudenhygromyxa sp. WMMC2535]|uniref:cytochrome C oxidase subunit IV family protein n=1 Tax=Pseudenhygromyxa sp. WMMC2535 TaxID=2712867 RepID=UPI0015526198|nr:cytochrome C oxidase subunit IV family protein [Pseudenhygromyxa sp. WMMC2535]NVB36517.1 cytochrome C oxidase subunit IV family protein [Pseudenhygromyxa sp. WMMC2535]